MLGSPGAKGQQSSAGDSEKNQYPRADKIEKRINRINRKIDRKLNRKIKKFVVADVGGYGNKDLYQVSLKLILEDGVFVLIASSNSTKFIEMARAAI